MTRLKVVVPTYNAEPWIERCLRSIASQSFTDFECLVIDDASTDGTFAVLGKLDFLDERFFVMRNPENRGPLANTWHGFERLGCRSDPEAVLTIVDGDDYLVRTDAFGLIMKTYGSDPTLLMTYGNYANDTDPSRGRCEPFPTDVIAKRAFREHRCVVSCLRTCKAKLWNGIKKEDLCYPGTDEFFLAGGDVAYLMPLLDMAGSRHRFISDIIYIYNTNNPISDGKIRNNEQTYVDDIVRNKPTYPLLEHAVSSTGVSR
jgi:glycosyltransferase involved in cell wall biosynthesis